MAGYKDLNVWIDSRKLVVDIYSISTAFPQEEFYGLVSQIRRAAVSVPSSIAEGCARRKNKENTQFLYVALGSLAEVETQLYVALDLGYTKAIDDLFSLIDNIRKMLTGLIKSLIKK